MGKGWPCATVECSFISLAACVRQLPFWLLNPRVVMECLQSGQLNLAKAVHDFDGVMSRSFNCRCLSLCDSELKLPSPRLRLKWQVLALTKSINDWRWR
jgi:hypothetical protein